jgi:proteasome lid subunit RPN8/RPN11
MKEPIITMSYKTYLKLQYYTLNSKDEIGGLIIINLHDPLHIDDIILPHQKVTSTSVDYNMKQLHSFIAQVLKDNPSILQLVKGTWHSHASMQTFMSNVDIENAENLSRSMGYVISIVSNHDMNLKAHLTVYQKGISIFHKEDVQIQFNEVDTELKEQCIKEIKERVTKEEPPVYKYPSDNNIYDSKKEENYWLHGGRMGWL